MSIRDLRFMWIRVNHQGTVAFLRDMVGPKVAVLSQRRARYARVIAGATKLTALALTTLLTIFGAGALMSLVIMAAEDDGLKSEPIWWFIGGPILFILAVLLSLALSCIGAMLLAMASWAGMSLIGGITVCTLDVFDEADYLSALYRHLDRPQADRICAEVKGMSGRDAEAVVIGVGEHLYALHELPRMAKTPKIAIGRILGEDPVVP